MEKISKDELVALNITELCARVAYLEKKVNEHENAFRWFEVGKKFFGKAVLAAYAAKVEIEKEGK